MESLQKLKDYANIKSDWYLNSLIHSIESEILEMKAKIEVYNELNKS